MNEGVDKSEVIATCRSILAQGDSPRTRYQIHQALYEVGCFDRNAKDKWLWQYIESHLSDYNQWRNHQIALMCNVLSQQGLGWGKALGSVEALDSRNRKSGDYVLINLAQKDLSGLYLSGIYLRRLELTKSTLCGADLSHSHFDSLSLHGADLREADLSASVLQHAVLWYADLRGANLQYADLRGAILSRAKLDGANVGGMLINKDTRLPDGYEWVRESAIDVDRPNPTTQTRKDSYWRKLRDMFRA